MQYLVLIADVSLGTIFSEPLSHFQGSLIHISLGAIFSEALESFSGHLRPLVLSGPAMQGQQTWLPDCNKAQGATVQQIVFYFLFQKVQTISILFVLF